VFTLDTDKPRLRRSRFVRRGSGALPIELTPAGDTLAIKLYGDLAQIIALSERRAGEQKGPVSDEVGQLLSGGCGEA
jgi:hypothetical protein